MKFIDIHTHSAWNSEIIQIKDISSESLSKVEKNRFYSYGVHPWFIQQEAIELNIRKIEQLVLDNSFLAIGECGLDKVCNNNFSLQMEVLKRQILLSEKYRKPLILHIVKAFNELIQLRRESKAKQAWIVHGFNGSSHLAEQLTNLGIYISFGFWLSSNISKASKCIETIPINRLFLETDNSEFSIEEIYSFASQHLSLNIEQLKSYIWKNFQTLFFNII